MWFRAFTVVMVMALGISTWFLSSPSHGPRYAASDDSKLPGYFLNGAVLTDYDADGTPGLRIEAKRMEQIAHSNEVDLFDVKVDYKPPEGESWTLFGDTAHVVQGAKIIDVQGNVRLEGEATGPKGLLPIIHTESLRYDVDRQIITTRDEVRLDFGPNVLTGRGLSANLKDRTMRLEYKVHGTFHP